MTRPFRISTGPSRLQTRIKRKKVSWAKLAKRLQTFDVIDVAYDDYLALPRDQQADLKDVGYFIGGQFNGPGRILEDMARRCCITLDIDHIDWLDLEMIQETYFDLEYVVHSTLKHSDETPRLRLVFPLSKDITPDKYEPIARKLADQLGMDCFDDTTFQPARIMFWPAVCRDGAIYKEHNKGFIIDPDSTLASYDDWTDFSEWPHSSRTDRPRGLVKQAEWPLDKPGVIGAFCRSFDIHSAIARFELPYESTDFDNRYLPVGASGAAGAVVYDDVFLYSNHESDAVGLQNVNAWDLVRAHRFGSLDDGIDDDVPMMQRPSSKEMTSLALNQKEVNTELAGEELGQPNGEDRSADRLGVEAGPGVAESTLTYDDISKDIANLKPGDREGMHGILNRVAAARLDALDTDMLAGQLKDAAKIPKAVTMKSVETIKASLGAPAVDKDIQREFIQVALDEHYAGGRTLKRIGKVCWRYQKGKWSIVTDEPVRGRIGRTFTRLKVDQPADAKALLSAIEDQQTSTLVNSITQLMFDDMAVNDDHDDPLQLMRSFTLPIINCTNCEIHFKADGSYKAKKQKPEHFYTTRIETEFDPKAKCPQWDRFMQIVFSDAADPDDMVRHFEELGGYIIQMSRWLKTWVMLYGPKDTGKSTAAMLLQEILGPSFLTKAMAQAGKAGYAFEEEAIIGKLLMVDDDFPAGGSLPDGFMKKYSEEKPATANIKFGSAVNFRARCLPMLLTNHWPIVHDTTPAFLERALIIPFTHRFTGAERDDQARAAMMKELPGILNRFIAGLSRLRERGSWDVPITCNEAASEWEARANPFLSFIYECCEFEADYRIERTDLYNAFAEWYSMQSGSKNVHSMMHKRAFFERCREKFIEVKSSGVFHFRGIRIADSAALRVNELKVVESDDWDD